MNNIEYLSHPFNVSIIVGVQENNRGVYGSWINLLMTSFLNMVSDGRKSSWTGQSEKGQNS